MSGLFLFGGILLVLIVTIVWAAIRAGDDTGAALEPAERRDAAIEALRDLELEFRTGKLTDEEYRDVRAHLEREALDARNRARGAREPVPASPPGPADSDPRAHAGTPAYCSACGAAFEGDEVYCSECGGKV